MEHPSPDLGALISTDPTASGTPPARTPRGDSRAEGVARWLGLAANLGALVGLLLVVVQLRQNRDLTRAQVRHELAAGIVDLLQVPASNPQLASVLRRGSAGEPLTPDEAFQFRMRSNALLRYWEDVHYQYRQGLYDEVEFSRQKDAWRDSIRRSVGLQRYWCEVHDLYSPAFAQAMDALMPQDACTPAPAVSGEG